jgi:hypothetical protein
MTKRIARAPRSPAHTCALRRSRGYRIRPSPGRSPSTRVAFSSATP